jgi:uncharacterized protein YjbI with pentapeptide repeats
MDLLELLVAGKVEEFNEARGGQTKLDLFAADLSGANLAGVDLSGADLQKADLTGTDLTDALLTKANLSGADLSATKLSGAMALRSKWREAYLEDVDLSEIDLSGADLSEVEMINCKAMGMVLSSGRMKNANLQNCDFSDADLTEARLGGCTMQKVTWDRAQLVATSLRGVTFSQCSFGQAELSRARLTEAVFDGSDLSDATCVATDLSGATLKQTKVDGADFTRADLTGVILEGTDLRTATLADAAVDDPTLVASEAPKATMLLIEEPTIALSDTHAAVLWENMEQDGKGRLRLAIGRLGRPYKGSPPAMPVPCDLVVARGIVAVEEGFMVLLLVERPGGLATTLFTVDTTGTIIGTQQTEIPYTPAVQPLFKRTDKGIRLYGISREGPGVHVHALTQEGLVPLVTERMPTARGFASQNHPTVLSKGGVMVQLNDRGTSEPIRTPAGFPGRSCAAVPHEEGLHLVWTSPPGLGLRVANALPGESPEVLHLLKETPVGRVDAASAGGQSYALYTEEPETPDGAASAWCMQLPMGTPFPIIDDPMVDVDTVRAHVHGSKAYAVVTTITGGLEILRIGANKVTSRWKIGN